MIKFFIDYRISWLIGLPLIILTYSLVNTYTSYHFLESDLSFGLFPFKIGKDFFVIKIITPLVIYLNATLISQIFNHHNFIEKNTYTSPLFYLILMSFFDGFYSLNSFVLSHTFFILSLSQYFKINPSKESKKLIFNASFFFSIGACLSPSFISFFPFVFFMILVSRPFLIREMAISFLGLIVPLFYVYTSQYFKGKTSFSIDLFPPLIPPKNPYIIFFLALTIFFLLFFSRLSITSRIKKPTVKLRLQFKILAYWFFIGIVSITVCFILKKGFLDLSFIIIPTVFVLTYGFFHKNKARTYHILFYLLFFFSFIKFFV